MRQPIIDTDRRSRLLAASLLWLCGGSLLLLSTLVPAHTALLGWAPMFWLLWAPLAVTLTLEPKLPHQLLALRRSRRRNTAHLIWN